jgi:hypothetical protein
MLFGSLLTVSRRTGGTCGKSTGIASDSLQGIRRRLGRFLFAEKVADRVGMLHVDQAP